MIDIKTSVLALGYIVLESFILKIVCAVRCCSLEFHKKIKNSLNEFGLELGQNLNSFSKSVCCFVNLIYARQPSQH